MDIEPLSGILGQERAVEAIMAWPHAASQASNIFAMGVGNRPFFLRLEYLKKPKLNAVQRQTNGDINTLRKSWPKSNRICTRIASWIEKEIRALIDGFNATFSSPPSKNLLTTAKEVMTRLHDQYKRQITKLAVFRKKLVWPMSANASSLVCSDERGQKPLEKMICCINRWRTRCVSRRLSTLERLCNGKNYRVAAMEASDIRSNPSELGHRWK